MSAGSMPDSCVAFSAGSTPPVLPLNPHITATTISATQILIPAMPTIRLNIYLPAFLFLNKIQPLFNNIKLLFTFCKQNLNIIQKIFTSSKTGFPG
jgi:hypothetical protein